MKGWSLFMTEQYKSRTEKRRANQKNKQKQPKGKGKSIAKKIFLTMIIVGFLCLVGGLGTFAYFVSDAPKLDPQKLKVPVPSKIYDMNKDLVTELGTEKRDLVEFDEIPDLVKNAVLATEDVRFFKHNGIDLIRLGGAVISNVTDGFGSQGASTLTQQVVKLSFLSEEKTLKRKAQEAWLALQLERNFSKEDIFEMYVNRVSMGGNVYGIKAAAQTYFNKSLDELTLPEAALIAGLPQRPNAYNPFVNPDLADQRKNTVLSLMHQHGFISEKEMKEAQNISIASLIVDKPEDTIKDDSPYDSFVDQIIEEVEALGYNAYTDGLEIYTTMDPNAQKRVNDILNTNEYIKYPNDEIQAGVILLDTKSGEIRAIGGGRHQKVRRGLNYAIDIKRQPGSTIKPILDYGPAIEYLKYSTYQIFEDKPYHYSDGTPVKNYNNKYAGEVTMRYALQKSLNIPAIQALQAVGLDKSKEFANGLGIGLEEIYESYAIGGFKTGVSPLQLAGAYSAFGNGGIYNEPYAIKKIVLSDGETEINLEPKPERAMSDYTAFMITDMLKTVVQSGTGVNAKISGLPIAGKTGTTNYTKEDLKKYNLKDGSPDAWFAGYSTNYTAAVWVGYEKKSKPVDNTQLPLYIFKSLMTYIHDGIETPDFKQPSSVVKLPIEKGSNPAKLASPFTPESDIVYEYFVKGTEPKETSKKYESVPAVTNLSVDYNEQNATASLNWDYENVDNINFEVHLSADGSGDQTLGTTDKNSFTVNNLVPGLKYTFTVYAVYDGNKSDPASVTLDLSSFSNNSPNNQGNEEDTDNEGTGDQGDDNNNSGNTTGPGTTPGTQNPGTPGQGNSSTPKNPNNPGNGGNGGNGSAPSQTGPGT
jgi:penicillin-binding protein 1A